MPRRPSAERDLESYAAVARKLAETAGAVSLRYFRNEFVTETKPDQTPVTIADRECERLMREQIRKACPDHGIIGEEEGSDRPDASYVWVLDPIDGTKAFVSGRPLFGSLIALCREGTPVVGIIHCPAVDDCWVGIENRPTTHNDMPCHTRRCGRLEDALMYSTSPYMFRGDESVAYERLRPLVKYPLFGGDCHNYGLAASGWIDLVVEAGLGLHDWAAMVPIAYGAGGRITDWNGKPLGFESDGRVVMAGDERIHFAAVQALDA
ncbi:MAG TPA: inositol monophosphatase family protein [Candidatus Binatia bacterium]|jgi:histidinol phosphatase-like enzyme (inositol monophosphatase family)